MGQMVSNTEVVQESECNWVDTTCSTPLMESPHMRLAVPLEKKVDVPVEAAPDTTVMCKTTLILRNIPLGASRSAIMDLLRHEGFADHVVFIYLPMNLRNSGNFGYAFVDFDSSQVALRCKETLEGFNEWSGASGSALEI